MALKVAGPATLTATDMTDASKTASTSLSVTVLPHTYYLPLVANGSFDGGTYRTTFILFNNTDKVAAVDLWLTKDDGNPLNVAIPESASGAVNQFTVYLNPGACRMLQTDGSGLLAAGADPVTANIPIGVSEIYTIYDRLGAFYTEVAVGDSQPEMNIVIPVKRLWRTVKYENIYLTITKACRQ